MLEIGLELLRVKQDHTATHVKKTTLTPKQPNEKEVCRLEMLKRVSGITILMK